MYKAGAFGSVVPAAKAVGRGAKIMGAKAARVGVAASLPGLVGLVAYSIVEWCAHLGWGPVGYEPTLAWPYPPVLVFTSLFTFLGTLNFWEGLDVCQHDWVVEKTMEVKQGDAGEAESVRKGEKYLDLCKKCGERRERSFKV